MEVIKIKVTRKVPVIVDRTADLVRDNKYRFVFEFDEDWKDAPEKYAWIIYKDKTYTAHLIKNNSVELEIVRDEKYILVGISQEDTAVSRPVELEVKKSIYQYADESVEPPEPSLWDEIRGLVKNAVLSAEKAEQSEKSAKESAEGAATAKVAAEAAAVTAGESASSALNSASAAEKSAERAEQVAVANGYAEFYMKNGRIYLVRTENIVDKVDFELKEGRMVVKISG
jgi:hypothetical protein